MAHEQPPAPRNGHTEAPGVACLSLLVSAACTMRHAASSLPGRQRRRLAGDPQVDRRAAVPSPRRGADQLREDTNSGGLVGVGNVISGTGMGAGGGPKARMDWLQLRDEIIATTAKVGDQLRALPDGDLRLSRVTWSASELGAHLVSLPRRYRRMVTAPQPFPVSVAADNQRELDLVAERDPARLADLLRVEVAGRLDAYGDDGARQVWYFTVEHTVAGLGGIMLTELLVHGGDLADARREPWSITRTQAVARLRGILPAIVLLVNEQVAATATGTYHVHLRGGDDWTVRVYDGAVKVARGRPHRADLYLSADPVTFLRNAYGLIGNTRAALSGGVIAWGRRPWLATRFARLFVET